MILEHRMRPRRHQNNANQDQDTLCEVFGG